MHRWPVSQWPFWLAVLRGRAIGRRHDAGQLAKLTGKVRLIRIAGCERHVSELRSAVVRTLRQPRQRAGESLHAIEVLQRESHRRMEQLDEMSRAVTGAPLNLLDTRRNIMAYRIEGLAAEPFAPMFGLNETELAERRALRVTADGACARPPPSPTGCRPRRRP